MSEYHYTHEHAKVLDFEVEQADLMERSCVYKLRYEIR